MMPGGWQAQVARGTHEMRAVMSAPCMVLPPPKGVPFPKNSPKRSLMSMVPLKVSLCAVQRPVEGPGVRAQSVHRDCSCCLSRLCSAGVCRACKPHEATPRPARHLACGVTRRADLRCTMQQRARARQVASPHGALPLARGANVCPGRKGPCAQQTWLLLLLREEDQLKPWKPPPKGLPCAPPGAPPPIPSGPTCSAQPVGTQGS